MKEWLILFRNVDTEPFLNAFENADKKDVDITDRSTKGEKSKQQNLLTIDTVGVLFHNYIKKIKDIDSNLNYKYGWCVEGNKGSYHRLHNHTFAKEGIKVSDGISCLLYLDVPQGDDTGEFYYLVRNELTTDISSIMPQKGDLIVMANSVFHGVYPQKIEGLRRTLNFDFTYAN